jgi:HEPN superfamily RiboL-PSP-like protein
MNGQAEIWRLKQRLDATFKRAAQVGSDLELQSDFACYLCILVSGYLERAIIEIVLEHSRQNSSPSIQRFVESRTRNLTNLNSERLRQLFGSLNADWQQDLELFLVDERKDAIDSIVNLRNTLAHGRPAGVTYNRVAGYYEQIQNVIDHIIYLCEL